MTDVPVHAFAVVSRFMSLKIEMIVLGVEGGYALFANGAVHTSERWGLWADHPFRRKWSGVAGEG
jgi:hypothetical protein